MINARAEGGAYHRVMVNGAEWSKHSTDYKAAEVAYDVALVGLDHFRRGVIPTLPVVYVDGARRIYYETDPNMNADVVIAAPSEPVVSDGGEDFVDFIRRNATRPDPNDPTVIRVESTGVIERDVAAQIEACKDLKLGARIWSDVDGDGVTEFVGLTWRGYSFQWWQRVHGAFKVGATP